MNIREDPVLFCFVFNVLCQGMHQDEAILIN